MLAGIRDYLYPWQIPLILLLISGCIFGGGYLFFLLLKRLHPEKGVKIGQAIGMVVLAGAGGFVATLVGYFLVDTISAALRTSAIMAGLVAFIIVSYLIFYSMLNLSAKETLRVSGPAIAAVVVFTMVVGAAGGIPAYRKTQFKHNSQVSVQKLSKQINTGVIHYEARMGQPPPTLEALVQDDISPQDLICPINPRRKIGYFYMPSPSRSRRRQGMVNRIRACEFKVPNCDDRAVLMCDGIARRYEEVDFQELLRLPENIAFAKALSEVERKRTVGKR